MSPSKEHEDKIEEISREIESRSMDWKTRKNYPIWLGADNKNPINSNSWGLIDVMGFKNASQNNKAEIEMYEVEEKSSMFQQNKNFEKMNIAEKSFPLGVIVSKCQLKSNQDHKDPKVCPKNNQNKFRTQFRQGGFR
jgi:hypothetical protein